MRTTPRHKERMSVDGATVDHFAIAHVKNAMAVGGGFGVVGDHHNGLPEIFIELAQKVQHRFRTLSVEVSRGLIGKDDFGLADNRARERYTLLFAS